VKIRAIEFEHRVELLAMIDDPEQWVVDLENQTATIRPIWPEALAQFNLWPHAKRFIFSSATMNAQYTLSMLGFDPNDADILEAPSSFAKEYRPIFLRSDLILNYKSMQDHTILRKWVDQIDEIISMYPDHKGLIHTGNYQLANLLTINSRHANRLLSHTAETRLITLERFKDLTEPKVLVSPSMTEGVDLPYEKCRFQIIGKIPYPNMIDKVWNARFEQNKEKAGTIYRQATIDQVVQATGRGMRADDDYCETWIIDGNILRLLQYTADFPKFFREAIRRV
jgi:Rad3-related DNA helicase